MPSLHELQRSFAAALFEEASAPPGDVIRADGIDPAARLQIYRAQLHATFRRALALEFPVIERLVGSDFFARLARELQAAHASRSGDLQHIGAPFAVFLRNRFSGRSLHYLSDVAALEWAYQESMCAADSPAFDLNALQAIPPDAYGGLHFSLHPACRLVNSGYPVLDIWRVNQADSAATESIDLGSGACRVLLFRSGHEVEFRLLSRAEFAFLDSLTLDSTLDAAFDAAHSETADFDLGAALRDFVASGVLTAVTLHSSCAAATTPHS